MLEAVRWTISHRIIRTIYPPVDLFEDVADPADWELLVSAEAKIVENTNVVAFGEQEVGQVRADEPCPAGDRIECHWFAP
jgi:hypothetical protein